MQLAQMPFLGASRGRLLARQYSNCLLLASSGLKVTPLIIADVPPHMSSVQVLIDSLEGVRRCLGDANRTFVDDVAVSLGDLLLFPILGLIEPCYNHIVCICHFRLLYFCVQCSTPRIGDGYLYDINTIHSFKEILEVCYCRSYSSNVS